ncbi:hypothetical protein E2C01_028685 [Portunus trituberculatus]|uniref:Uncharacterized protein n=1 Tax=Portunus trituberculatus TaxID=210409 RepID=A0A5B7EPD4_PORTR|nr:hypothetical protein [Portunus trituberculatus]
MKRREEEEKENVLNKRRIIIAIIDSSLRAKLFGGTEEARGAFLHPVPRSISCLKPCGPFPSLLPPCPSTLSREVREEAGDDEVEGESG